MDLRSKSKPQMEYIHVKHTATKKLSNTHRKILGNILIIFSMSFCKFLTSQTIEEMEDDEKEYRQQEHQLLEQAC